MRPPSRIRPKTRREIALQDALRPFASISLERDEEPDGPDMIAGPDLAITPDQVRRARRLLGDNE